MTRALIVVDVQNDFCEGGSMGVAGGAEVALRIGELLHRWAQADPPDRVYSHVVATRDHHVDPGAHFSAEPDFVDSWPRHSVAGTDGAAFHSNLDPQPFDAVFDKGEYEAAYSGFEGADQTADRWPSGCATMESPTSTSSGSPRTTACAPPRWTTRAKSSTRACCWS